MLCWELVLTRRVGRRAIFKLPLDKSPAERVVMSAKLEVALSIWAQV